MRRTVIAALLCNVALVLVFWGAARGMPRRNQLAFISALDGHNQLYLMDAERSLVKKFSNLEVSGCCLTWSPDGENLAFMTNFTSDGTSDIYIASVDEGWLRRLTDGVGVNWLPIWSPNNHQIAFSSYRDGDGEIYVIDIISHTNKRLTTVLGADWFPLWSPDGQWLAFVSQRDGNSEIYLMDGEGDQLRRLTNNPANDVVLAWTADGSHLAFVSDQSGKDNVYVMDLKGDEVTLLPQTLNYRTHGWPPDPQQVQMTVSATGALFEDNLSPPPILPQAFGEVNPVWRPE